MKRRLHECEEEQCGKVLPRPVSCDRPCPKCGGRMLLRGRGRPGRPTVDVVPVKLTLPREWVMKIRERSKVQPFVREAVREKLES